MNDPRDIRDDLEAGTPDELIRLAERLEAQRPLPAPGFRGDLRRHLLARAAPRRLHARIAAFAGSGGALLALAFASAAGAGPFGS